MLKILSLKGVFVGNALKLIIVLFFAITLFYAITSSSVLQRVSYDIYECENQEHGEIKIWFKDLTISQRFEFTRNGVSRNLEILKITNDKVTFEDGKIAMELDMSTKRLLQDDQSLVTMFVCKLDKFTM